MPLDIPRQAFAVHPIIGAPLGAEVVGLDLSRPLGAEDFSRLHRAHLDHHVLVFRDQHITPAQQVAFSRRFGQLQIHVLRNFQLTGHPEVLIVSNIRENGQPIGLGDAGHFWHSDLSYKETPSLGSMLHAQELPAEGGDTLFANQHTAWEALPDDLKREVEGLQAEHWYLAKYEALRQKNPFRPQLTQAQIDEVKPVHHPVVRTHPETGRRLLYLNRFFGLRIIGLPDDESQALIDRLCRQAEVMEYQCRFQWSPGSVAFWDNRAVQHYACSDYWPARRVMERATVIGDRPA